jgi:hypothetical protein
MVLFEPILYSDKTIGLPEGMHNKMGDDTMRRKNGWATRADWEKYLNTKAFYTSWSEEALRLYLDVGVVGVHANGQVCWSTGPVDSNGAEASDEPMAKTVVLKTDPFEEASIFRGSMSCTSAYFERLGEINVPAVVISGAESDIGLQKMPGKSGEIMPKDHAIASMIGQAVWKALPGQHMLVQQDRTGVVGEFEHERDDDSGLI